MGRPPARGAGPDAPWLRDCLRCGDTGTSAPPGLPGEESALGTPPGERTIGGPVTAAREPPDADDGTLYTRGNTE
ncbi:hypothetical protein NDU88_000591 [Pleurodeles waltl]|uniref:Uncharacterized protein n=1 Tax=Pleurodeles waltl TaxID=8319 RepID=A0AAV7WK46_PLEWA|nr:hypothetical protein NDU88_000591 [Pleurodeles waltl]